ncbi:MAG: hypothetical protein ACP5JJ_11220, partial [Anaerolineae bacterium]
MPAVSIGALLDPLGARAAGVLIAVGVLLCPFGCRAITRQPAVIAPTGTPAATSRLSPTWTGIPTSTPIPTPTRTAMPTPGPLNNAEAVVLMEEEMTARGVASDTVKIVIAGEPQVASIRYVSDY